MTNFKQLNFDDRLSIEAGLKNNYSFKLIAQHIAKDPTTVSKEIRSHLIFKQSGAYGRSFNDCSNRKECRLVGLCDSCSSSDKRLRYCSFCGKCCSHCVLYSKQVCSKLSKPPYVCNACPQLRSCSLEKRFYEASKAQAEYLSVLSDSRKGFALSDAEINRLDSIISPLLLKGQSIHHICLNHKAELMLSERTLYKYIDQGLFSARNIDMPRKVRLRPSRKRPDSVKIDSKCRIGRSFADFNSFTELHPDSHLVQLDSVLGTPGGAALLTITFISSGLQLAFKRDHNDSQSVTDIFTRLFFLLGFELFSELFAVILADNGSEFSDPLSIEFDANGNRRSHLFYCDPSAPYQKGSCEARHEMIRRIIPKGADFSTLSQAQISLMMSHINSYKRKSLGNKSPYELFAFQFGHSVLDDFGLSMIPSDDITLSPALFK